MGTTAELVPADMRGDLALYALPNATGKAFDWGWWLAGYKAAILRGDITTVKLLLVLALENGLN